MVRPGLRLTTLAVGAMLVICAGRSLRAQKVISAKAGLVYFVQGRVSVAGSGRLPAGATLRQLRDGETLSTERGRVEVLLNPGAVLRLGDMSRMRIDDITLTDPRLSLESGSAVVTVSYILKPDLVVVAIGGSEVALTRAGVYRFDVSLDATADRAAGKLRVYNGRAEVRRGNSPVATLVKRGQAVEFEDLQIATFDTKTFDTKKTDDLEQWADRRSRGPGPRFPRPLPPRIGWPGGQADRRSTSGQLSDVSLGDASAGPISTTTNRTDPNQSSQLNPLSH